MCSSAKARRGSGDPFTVVSQAPASRAWRKTSGKTMNGLLSRSSAVIAGLCATAVLALVALCGIAIDGLSGSAEQAERLNADEVATISLVARFSLQADRAYTTGASLALGGPDAGLAAELYDERIPAVEALLTDVRRIHQGGTAEDRQRVVLVVTEWEELRTLLNDGRLGTPEGAAAATGLRQKYAELSRHLNELVDDEQADAAQREDVTAGKAGRSTWLLVGASSVAAALIAGLGFLAHRRIRREIEPAQDQADFVDTLQLAESEEEAHQLLQRRLVRVVRDSDVTVLNRNNSADRLEPMTEVAPESELAAGLERAAPRSCLAIRSARPHDEDPDRPALLGCDVCGPCPGFSTCTPLTVGGEVIGSVLVNRSGPCDDHERRQLRDSVSQAAPVLANLRNLAIAELRAATDALTGLPNKRAVSDNLRRMFAQASRTASPMALVLLDLDHFKKLNDTFGHQVGDQALASVGATMLSSLRDNDFAGRSGGEEFAIILPGTDAAGAQVAADKLRQAIADITVPGLDLQLTASLGVAVYPEHALSPERLERLADAALYLAKRSGRNRVEVATDTPDPLGEPDASQNGTPVAPAAVVETRS
jgi:diguanylate cyclase (GGDEF)-like protein